MDLLYRNASFSCQHPKWVKHLVIVLAVFLQISLSGSNPASADDDASSQATSAQELHAALLLREQYPSARSCAGCHPTHYKEWSISQHAYAQMSPVFNAMQGTVIHVTNGTNGDFCIRCHTPVGMNLKEKEFMSNIDRHPTSREGVTCIACHRISKPYGKISGRLSLQKGDLTQPINGPRADEANLKMGIEDGGLITDNDKAGRKVHGMI
ncbi:MAG: hypothetical protein JKX85_04980, partial [Phycisphaeraceae bacterium]|nr:hypothetical protein [Phycisphaeraceae bacterium]